VQTVFVAPGNGGTAVDPALRNVPITDLAQLADFAAGREDRAHRGRPRGAAGRRRGRPVPRRGLRIFGPTQAAAQLESSKAFAKAFMQRHGIPTARYETFTDAARRMPRDATGAPIVIKADGLAAGKGVVVAMTLAEAHAAIDDMLGDNTSGRGAQRRRRARGHRGVHGRRGGQLHRRVRRQACGGAGHQPGPQAHAGDGDTGPNTGGMGAYSPGAGGHAQRARR
jgi:phosphoribosylamine--glycine ligase